MPLPQRYAPAEAERRWQEHWAATRIYAFDPADPRPIFAIDTPPPTVSGELHLGHVYSYVQAEAMIRFWRMRGHNVYYPFGFDDNGLPTERYVERINGIRARDVGRTAFVAMCLAATQAVEARFEAFWQRLGFSADWCLRYSTIDERARRTAQWSFLDLYRKGRIYRAQAPNLWCIECQTAIAQAEVEDAERAATFWRLDFRLSVEPGTEQLPGDQQSNITIATTRPELLPACVAVFIHPADPRYLALIGREAITPLIGRRVPILADPTVDLQKGTGAVMCCTFGDTADVNWWRAHDLPLIPLISRDGRLSEHGGAYAGMTLHAARAQIIADLRAAGAIRGEQATAQSVRVHERCGSPLEILESSQWFIRVLDIKNELLAAGRQITWHPAYMRTRYEHWVENLGWDWCISRQRLFGVPFPLWRCDGCSAVVLADAAQLPVDPQTTAPPHGCACGGRLIGETDILDTWATSSVSPQIAGNMLDDPTLFARLFPMALRPQAHDIIRTWAFDTIVKAHLHHGTIPWQTVLISGHGLDPGGKKLSKSKGNASNTPEALLDRYSADALRYWACGGSPGADQLLDEDTIKRGEKLVTKLWNASRLIDGIQNAAVEVQSSKFKVQNAELSEAETQNSKLKIQGFEFFTPVDRAVLSWLQRLVARATASMAGYDYVAALEATEQFFWATLCDNYLELVKGRLYDGGDRERAAALAMLRGVLQTLLKLFAPFLPHVTEEIWSHMYASNGNSIHLSAWPNADQALIDVEAERAGEAIFTVVAHVRRFKSEQKIGLGTPLAALTITTSDTQLHGALTASAPDLRSATRAVSITVVEEPGGLSIRPVL